MSHLQPETSQWGGTALSATGIRLPAGFYGVPARIYTIQVQSRGPYPQAKCICKSNLRHERHCIQMTSLNRHDVWKLRLPF